MNANPIIYEKKIGREGEEEEEEDDSLIHITETAQPEAEHQHQHQHQRQPFDPAEIFQHIRHINDPEHPLTLEQLNVAQLGLIQVDDRNNTIRIQFTPTIPHCSMATLIGLCIRVKLIRSLPMRFKVDVQITPGTHQSEKASEYSAAKALPNSMAIVIVKVYSAIRLFTHLI